MCDTKTAELGGFLLQYSSFCETLKEVFPKNQVVATAAKHCLGLREDEEMLKSFVTTWANELGGEDTLAKLQERDSSIFLSAPRVLVMLDLPAIWIKDLLAETGKVHAWQYLVNLTGFALRFAGKEGAEGLSKPHSWRASEHKNAKETPDNLMEGISGMYKHIPNSVIAKAKKIAEKHQDTEGGEVDVGKLSQDIFSQLEPAELQETISNMGGLIGNLMSNPEMRGLVQSIGGMLSSQNVRRE